MPRRRRPNRLVSRLGDAPPSSGQALTTVTLLVHCSGNKHRCPSPARSRTARPRQAILRALWIPGVTAASDDAHASIEYRKGLKDKFQR